jgi:hypothetical protein
VALNPVLLTQISGVTVRREKLIEKKKNHLSLIALLMMASAATFRFLDAGAWPDSVSFVVSGALTGLADVDSSVAAFVVSGASTGMPDVDSSVAAASVPVVGDVAVVIVVDVGDISSMFAGLSSSSWSLQMTSCQSPVH